MPMKLMERVRPGVELTWASLCPSRELIRLDLPTLDRPRNANSGGPSAGNKAGLVAAAINRASMSFIGMERVTHDSSPYGPEPKSKSKAKPETRRKRRIKI